MWWCWTFLTTFSQKPLATPFLKNRVYGWITIFIKTNFPTFPFQKKILKTHFFDELRFTTQNIPIFLGFQMFKKFFLTFFLNLFRGKFTKIHFQYKLGVFQKTEIILWEVGGVFYRNYNVLFFLIQRSEFLTLIVWRFFWTTVAALFLTKPVCTFLTKHNGTFWQTVAEHFWPNMTAVFYKTWLYFLTSVNAFFWKNMTALFITIQFFFTKLDRIFFTKSVTGPIAICVYFNMKLRSCH